MVNDSVIDEELFDFFAGLLLHQAINDCTMTSSSEGEILQTSQIIRERWKIVIFISFIKNLSEKISGGMTIGDSRRCTHSSKFLYSNEIKFEI